MQTKTRLAIFDIDGTLTDSVAAFQEAYYVALQPFEFKTIDTNWGHYEHHTDSWIFQKIFQTNHDRAPNDVEKDQFSKDLLKNFLTNIEKNPIEEIKGAAAFLNFLDTETPWAIAFATGSLKPPADIKLSVSRMPFENKPLATASDFLTRHDIVMSARKESEKLHRQNSFEKVISFGDGVWDYKTAKDIHLPFIGIGKGPKADALSELGNKVFPDFEDHKALFNHMNN